MVARWPAGGGFWCVCGGLSKPKTPGANCWVFGFFYLSVGGGGGGINVFDLFGNIHIHAFKISLLLLLLYRSCIVLTALLKTQ